MEWLVISLSGVVGVMFMIFYYILDNKIKNTGLSTREITKMESKIENNISNLTCLRKKAVQKSLCDEKHKRIDEIFERIENKLESIENKLDAMK